VTIEYWTDGTVYASLPSARVYAVGTRSPAAALDALAEEIVEIVHDLTEGEHAKTPLGGAILDTWRALSALIDAPGLDGRSRELTVGSARAKAKKRH
jgi:hypothetical protein